MTIDPQVLRAEQFTEIGLEAGWSLDLEALKRLLADVRPRGAPA